MEKRIYFKFIYTGPEENIPKGVKIMSKAKKHKTGVFFFWRGWGMRGKAICVGAPLKKQTHLLNIFSGKIQSPYNGCNMRAIQSNIESNNPLPTRTPKNVRAFFFKQSKPQLL